MGGPWAVVASTDELDRELAGLQGDELELVARETPEQHDPSHGHPEI